MRVLALTKYGEMAASSRVRTYQFASYLCKYGIELTISPLLSDNYLKCLYRGSTRKWLYVLRGYLDRIAKLRTSEHFDLLWIEKELFPDLPYWSEQLLTKDKIHYVVDYDDAVFHNYDLSEQLCRRKLAGKIEKIMRHANTVICGNSYIAERARNSGASRIEILPTVVDLNDYHAIAHNPRREVVVGWIGSPTTVKYLDDIRPVFRKLSRRIPLQVRVIGADFYCEGVDIVCRPWSKDREVQEIQDMDIGIMPLPDTPWERGKCAYKLIQYMACGKPVVGSPVGMNVEVIHHENNGFLASSEGDWVEGLSALSNSPELRTVMGTLGRQRVEERYSVERIAPRLADLLLRQE